ncbi:MAG TPA: hypothetical protein VLR49_10740, partial [Ferruginibacter sp.]|nr:hypothetical protein [Ferruginibacter sp.]
MSKRYNSLWSILVIAVFILWGCNKNQDEQPCVSFSKAGITKIEGPLTASVNQEIPLTVSFSCMNGCGQFGNFEESTVGNTTTIVLNAKYEGCVCTQDIPSRQTIYSFKKIQTGTYILKFWETAHSYL